MNDESLYGIIAPGQDIKKAFDPNFLKSIFSRQENGQVKNSVLLM